MTEAVERTGASASFAFGVYGALKDQPHMGRNWRGRSNEWFRTNWGMTRFERNFTTSSCDRNGCLQIRKDADDWVVSLTRAFEGRNQSTWCIARMKQDELWDWLLPFVRAVRALRDDEVLELSTLSMQMGAHERELRLCRRNALPYLRTLARGATLPSSQQRSVVEPADPAVGFEVLIECAAFWLQFVHAHADGSAEPSAAVLSTPIARNERQELLDAGWTCLWAPSRRSDANAHLAGARSNTTPFVLVPDLVSERGVEVDALSRLGDGDFDGLFAHLRAGENLWNVPPHAMSAAVWNEAERYAQYDAWLDLRDRGERRSRFERYRRDYAEDADRGPREFELALLAELGDMPELASKLQLPPALSTHRVV